MTRYQSEFAMLEMPAFVRRTILPILASIGRALGKYDKYRDAPEPMTAERLAAEARLIQP